MRVIVGGSEYFFEEKGDTVRIINKHGSAYLFKDYYSSTMTTPMDRPFIYYVQMVKIVKGLWE
jgi:hypothetical protein